MQGLEIIESGKFKTKADCRRFFSELIRQNGLKTDADKLMEEVARVAEDARYNGYVYDGPSSTVPLDPDKFAGSATAEIKTVGGLFAASPGLVALTQFNGPAIWIRADDWGGLLSPYGSGTASQYGLGTLLHELIHKQMVGGGFDHNQMKAALGAVGRNPADFSGQNGISRELGVLCF